MSEMICNTDYELGRHELCKHYFERLRDNVMGMLWEALLQVVAIAEQNIEYNTEH